MHYLRLTSIILIVVMIGCSGSDIETNDAPKTGANAASPNAETVMDSAIAKVDSTRANTKLDKAKTELDKAKADSSPKTTMPAEPQFEFANATFDAPIMLMAADEPMKAGHSYPSPVVFDIDSDGRDEMVLGDIFGSVFFCENEKEVGDPVWSAVEKFIAADGKPLKLNNW